MKIPNRTAARQTNKDSTTFAAVKRLSCLLPAQSFWTMFGATTPTIRAMMNVKAALDDQDEIILSAAKGPSSYHPVHIAGREKRSQIVQNEKFSLSTSTE